MADIAKYVGRIAYLRKAEAEEGNKLNELSIIAFLDTAQAVESQAQIGIAAEGRIMAEWGDFNKRCLIAIFNDDKTVNFADRTQGSDTRKLKHETGTVRDHEFRRRLVEMQIENRQ